MDFLTACGRENLTIQELKELIIDEQTIWVLDEFGNTALHYACKAGNLDIVKALIGTYKIPWNVVNNELVSAGQIAKSAGHNECYEYMVSEGCRAEFILGVLARSKVGEEKEEKISNVDYLNSKIEYTEDGKNLKGGFDTSEGVMMEWEKGLMKKHADIIEILNVGFGLGLIDTFIQESLPKRHTIIEAHPDVYNFMLKNGWDKKLNVEIKFGRWQDVIEDIGCFDGIFFDTFGENYDDLKQFLDHVPNLLKDENSVLSFFNGLAGTNSFFHDVYCRILSMDLQELGLSTEYIEEDVPKEIDEDGTWKNISRRYFSLDKYRLPVCKLDY
ncbi:hypothetical protein HK099_001173 [Clydaea vesicula]|uniref:RMT2 domain-containing protein n=1 Tax=Clydaea vesicula TaxID=447962 RepID=A0AAD5XX46_9FUNG|nr:hypothetical protein HK099_001173 [Clydaea vesicula]